MENTKSLRLNTCINPEIKKGDSVRIWDGSGLTCNASEKNFYIINSYEAVTGTKEILKDITAKVVLTNVTDKVSSDQYNDWCYLQDIEIKIGKARFRTCSAFVRKIQDL